MHLIRTGSDPVAGWIGLGRLKAPESPWLVKRLAGSAEDPAAAALRDVLRDLHIAEVDTRKRWRVELGPERPNGEREGAAAAWALGETGGEAAEAILLELVDSRLERVRHEACLALGRMRSKRAVPKLMAQLDDAIAFSRTPSPGDLQGIFAAWMSCRGNDPREAAWSQVREAAIAALEAVTGERVPGTIDEQVKAWKARK
jgi:HEAT repeat protein